jgi:DNA (cytosine-5)-methyltransferase 1
MNGLTLSLFPGIGLLDRAFEEQGFCVVRGPDLIWGGDIRLFHPPAGKFDGIIGGPPCQMFSSLAHLVRANGHEPKFGNLIPEFERCVREAQPYWFLMEEVPAAPVPAVEGYAVLDFILCNEMLDSGNGLGNAQMRKRRFSFGVRGPDKVDLRKWIRFAALELPDPAPTVTMRYEVDSCEARHRMKTGILPQEKTHAVVGDPRVRLTGDRVRKERAVLARRPDGTGLDEKPNPKRTGGTLPHTGRKRTWAESCELQGLPPDFLEHAPFTKEGKFRALGNGVPLTMGRELARAIQRAIAEKKDERDST